MTAFDYTNLPDQGGFCFRVKRCRSGNGWLAEAKRDSDPFSTDNAIDEPGELWFAFGDTEALALLKVKSELFN